MVSSGLANYVGTYIMFAGIYFCNLKQNHQISPSQTLMNLQYIVVHACLCL